MVLYLVKQIQTLVFGNYVKQIWAHKPLLFGVPDNRGVLFKHIA
jgi:hypothetical protein